jgi:copper chaperone CopZ
MAVERVTMTLYDLGCWGSGSLNVERALANLRGIQNVYVNSATETAYVDYDPDIASPRDMVRMIEGLGFRADTPVRR